MFGGHNVSTTFPMEKRSFYIEHVDRQNFHVAMLNKCQLHFGDPVMMLSSSRIYHILPQRIQQWNTTPCAAEESSKKNLEIIRNQQMKAQQLLAQLDRKAHILEALIAKAKQTPIALEQEVSRRILVID